MSSVPVGATVPAPREPGETQDPEAKPWDILLGQPVVTVSTTDVL